MTSQAQLESFYSSQLAAFAADYPSLNSPATNRTHCIAWSDWATQPKVELENGIRLDTNYYYWPGAWIQDRPGMFTGSGMPMRFADLDGSMIDVYQAATQMTDESDQTYPKNIDSLLNNALGPEGYYGVFTANMHTDSASSAGSDAIVASAQSHGVPVVSAQQMLQWLDGRNQSSFDGISWSGNTLSFTITHAAGANGLRGMVPTTSSVGALTTVKRDGVQIPTTTQTIKGREYAFFDADRRQLRGDLRRRQHRAGDLQRRRLGPGRRHRRHHLGHRRGLRPRRSTTEPIRTTWTQTPEQPGAVDLPQRPAHRARPEHHLLLPGDVRRRRDARAATRARSPAPPASASFTTPSASFTDTTVSDFSAGTPDANTYISETGNGEVILKPTEGQEFSAGPGLPAGWSSSTWESQGGGAGGSATVSGGSLHVDGAFAGTNATFGPGHSLEFVATFGAAAFQHVGFGVDFNSAELGDVQHRRHAPTSCSRAPTRRWHHRHPDRRASTSARRTSTGSSGTRTEVRYYVDGSPGRTRTPPTSAPPRCAARQRLQLRRARPLGRLAAPEPLSEPRAPSLSRVFDAGQAADWGAISWHANAPPGTSLRSASAPATRPPPTGAGAPSPRSPRSGGDVPGNSRYVQYRAELGSSDPNQTLRRLSDVSIAYSTGADTTAPTITQRTPAPNATNVPRNTNVDVQFSEPMNPATIDSSTVRLRKQGAGSDVPANVSYAGNTATIDPNADLDPSAVYNVTVAGTVTDANGNPLGADDTWSFTTASLSFIDTTVSDFSAGTPGANTYVSQTDNGEVTLKPTVGEEFSGSSVPAGWTSCPWTTSEPPCPPGATVSGGALHANGAYARTDTAYPAGRSLEFVATFNAVPFETAGFATDLNAAPWATFSTKADGNTLYTRTDNGQSGGQQETALGVQSARQPAPLPDRVGRRATSSSTWTAAWSRPTPSASLRTCA